MICISGVLRVVEEPRLVNIWIAFTMENHFGLFVTADLTSVKYDTQLNGPPQNEKRKYMGGL